MLRSCIRSIRRRRISELYHVVICQSLSSFLPLCSVPHLWRGKTDKSQEEIGYSRDSSQEPLRGAEKQALVIIVAAVSDLAVLIPLLADVGEEEEDQAAHADTHAEEVVEDSPWCCEREEVVCRVEVSDGLPAVVEQRYQRL